MAILTIDKVVHRGMQILLLRFPFDKQLINMVKQLPNAAWSKTRKAWYVPYSERMIDAIKKLFNEVAVIDTSVLDEKIAASYCMPSTPGIIGL